ncbi:squamosa promoter-binding-like protein 16 [Punica granatum]|uniref:Squamosa promoter-binding-like protein 16 n=2 Tax=Punica granatum TaxID=22663 RepID=A0A6P8DAB9_PUNGR|nr:squamosa promoter-binding-like protein 16 [Punica granatum]XP_031388159.1 squamosa promoter-binding-like protein 16 [Punica granatum]XP_031388160.1 squamosa promoter-binding-like protein 16 [Punica granatum]OWM89780.1 hypothetical protein CDL15_Pgr024528 [Punica granatum]PKI54218.1 hypothetical protein CRG98_025372 [Punica granatum]
MGYNFPATIDLVQVEKKGTLQIASIVNSCNQEPQRTQDALSVGLKLGSWSCVEEGPVQQSQNPGFTVMEPPSCGSSKRARAPNNGSQVPSCLVDGCNSDLSKCRDYHRRHKVCELHSKTPKVTIRGQEQRFCQQCSRFHSLGEFDDGKRSCRKRLDGHNRRRRKSQPDPSLSSSRFLANYQGTKFVPVSSSQIFPASALGACPWAGAVKSENDPVLYSSSSSSSSHPQQLNVSDRKMLFSASSPHGYRPQFQFPFMPGNKDVTGGTSVCEPTLSPNPVSGNNSGCSSQKMLPSCLVGALSNSECALSLLSSPLPAAAHQKGVGTTMQFDPQEPSHSSMPALHYNRVGTGEPTSSFLASPGSLHGMFRSGQDESSASGSQSHHTPSFTWE